MTYSNNVLFKYILRSTGRFFTTTANPPITSGYCVTIVGFVQHRGGSYTARSPTFPEIPLFFCVSRILWNIRRNYRSYDWNSHSHSVLARGPSLFRVFMINIKETFVNSNTKVYTKVNNLFGSVYVYRVMPELMEQRLRRVFKEWIGRKAD